MLKLRRNNMCVSSKNKNKENNVEINDIPIKLNKSKLMSHGEFLNRIQRSLYFSGRKSKMSIPLSDYIAEKFSENHSGYSLNRLNYSTVGNLRATPCSLILALCYLERLKDSEPAFTKHVTPTELFLVSMMVATKFYSGHDDEEPYVNWAEYMHTTSDHLLQIELSFLNAIDWRVYISNEEFFEKVKALEIILARQQGLNRGFFTYLELCNVMPSVQMAKQFIQHILVLAFSYTVFVATMVASVFLISQIPGTYLNSATRNTSTQSRFDTSPKDLNSQQPILSNDSTSLLPMTTELLKSEAEQNGSDLSVILNEAYSKAFDLLTQRKQGETRTQIPLMANSWYSLLTTHSSEWPVISDTCNDGMNFNLFCNSSTKNGILSTYPEPLKFSFDNIKTHWV